MSGAQDHGQEPVNAKMWVSPTANVSWQPGEAQPCCWHGRSRDPPSPLSPRRELHWLPVSINVTPPVELLKSHPLRR